MRYALLLLCFLFFQCNKESESFSSKERNDGYSLNLEEPTIDESDKFNPTKSEIKRTGKKDLTKIIKNGRLNIEVSKLEDSKNNIDSIIKYFGGYYEREEFISQYNSNRYQLKIRIPISKFDSLINSLESGIGLLKNKSLSSNDVTEEYVDMNIRLNNKLEYLNQYRIILKKAKSIKEILDVQERIRTLEEEIESTKGRIRYLDNKANYSTLDVELNTIIEQKVDEASFWNKLKNAFTDGFDGGLVFLLFVVRLWPFVIFVLVILLSIKLFKKKARA